MQAAQQQLKICSKQQPQQQQRHSMIPECMVVAAIPAIDSTEQQPKKYMTANAKQQLGARTGAQSGALLADKSLTTSAQDRPGQLGGHLKSSISKHSIDKSSICKSIICKHGSCKPKAGLQHQLQCCNTG
jgi:hypothetical protein